MMFEEKKNNNAKNVNELAYSFESWIIWMVWIEWLIRIHLLRGILLVYQNKELEWLDQKEYRQYDSRQWMSDDSITELYVGCMWIELSFFFFVEWI